jgi:hypothetical protein
MLTTHVARELLVYDKLSATYTDQMQAIMNDGHLELLRVIHFSPLMF